MNAIGTIDVSAWVGTYPFRGIEHSTIADLERTMDRLNIAHAIVSPFEALFWENNLDAWREWSQRLADHPQLEVWPVVNPSQPGAIAEFERLLQEHSIRGIRLLPNYHRYSLADAFVRELMALAQTHRLIVQVFERIADERWHWMLHVPAVPQADLDQFATTYGDQPIIICGSNLVERWAALLADHPWLHVDLSRLRYPVFGVEHVMPQLPQQQVVFGSLWPIQITEATLWQVTAGRISAEARQDILYNNAQRLLDWANASKMKDINGNQNVLQKLGTV